MKKSILNTCLTFALTSSFIFTGCTMQAQNDMNITEVGSSSDALSTSNESTSIKYVKNATTSAAVEDLWHMCGSNMPRIGDERFDRNTYGFYCVEKGNKPAIIVYDYDKEFHSLIREISDYNISFIPELTSVDDIDEMKENCIINTFAYNAADGLFEEGFEAYYNNYDDTKSNEEKLAFLQENFGESLFNEVSMYTDKMFDRCSIYRLSSITFYTNNGTPYTIKIKDSEFDFSNIEKILQDMPYEDDELNDIAKKAKQTEDIDQTSKQDLFNKYFEEFTNNSSDDIYANLFSSLGKDTWFKMSKKYSGFAIENDTDSVYHVLLKSFGNDIDDVIYPQIINTTKLNGSITDWNFDEYEHDILFKIETIPENYLIGLQGDYETAFASDITTEGLPINSIRRIYNDTGTPLNVIFTTYEGAEIPTVLPVGFVENDCGSTVRLA